VERPQRVGQLSECFGAGTGCGWCRPYLQRLFDESAAKGLQPDQSSKPPTPASDEPSAADYAKQRAAYVRSGGGMPGTGCRDRRCRAQGTWIGEFHHD